MRAIAIIPARGDSKRVPRKNLLQVNGQPLVAHSVRHALQAELVSEVYVSTEDPEIAAAAREAGALVVERPVELASDESSSEDALLDVLDELRSDGLEDPDLVVFLQCTSPVRAPDDVDGAIRTLIEQEADSLFSATHDEGLLWTLPAGNPQPINHNPERRIREQDMARQVRENGSIYVTRTPVLRALRNRLSPDAAVYEMDFFSSFQVDTPEDVELVSWILSRPARHAQPAWPARLDLIVFDFDGVMTDNRVYVGGSGDELVCCDRGDGLAVARLREAEISMLVLSTEHHPVVGARCEKLGIECIQGVADKGQRLREILSERRLDPQHVAFVGNDANDVGCLTQVGLPVVVADAHDEALAAARLVLSRNGGQGAVREFCDLALAHRAARR